VTFADVIRYRVEKRLLALFRYILLGFNSVCFDCGDRSTLAISAASYIIRVGYNMVYMQLVMRV